MWDYLEAVARLLDDRARVIRRDQRGCGRSQRRGPYRHAEGLATPWLGVNHDCDQAINAEVKQELRDAVAAFLTRHSHQTG